MKKRDFATLGRQLVESLGANRYRSAGSLVIDSSVRYLIKGFCFETSQNGAAKFYVWRFVMPLYVPVDVVDLSYGQRILFRNLEPLWDVTEPACVEQLKVAAHEADREYLSQFAELSEFESMISSRIDPRHVNSLEISAYANVLLDRIQVARSLLEQAQVFAASRVEWERTVADRASQIARCIDSRSKCHALLDEWSAYTTNALNIG